MSCLALTKEGKPCKNPAYYENCCYLKDHQLQVAEMKLQKLKEEKKEHYQSVLKNERIEVVEEAKKPFEELIKQNQDVIKKKEKENAELRAENEDLWNEITELKMGLRLNMRTIDMKDLLKRCEENEELSVYHYRLLNHWSKVHNKYFGKLPRTTRGVWPEEYKRTEGLEKLLCEVDKTLWENVRKQNFERAAELRDERTRLEKSLKELISQAKYVRPTFDEKGQPLDNKTLKGVACRQGRASAFLTHREWAPPTDAVAERARWKEFCNSRGMRPL